MPESWIVVMRYREDNLETKFKGARGQRRCGLSAPDAGDTSDCEPTQQTYHQKPPMSRSWRDGDGMLLCLRGPQSSTDAGRILTCHPPWHFGCSPLRRNNLDLYLNHHHHPMAGYKSRIQGLIQKNYRKLCPGWSIPSWPHLRTTFLIYHTCESGR